jgi:hypothetical protein
MFCHLGCSHCLERLRYLSQFREPRSQYRKRLRPVIRMIKLLSSRDRTGKPWTGQVRAEIDQGARAGLVRPALPGRRV